MSQKRTQMLSAIEHVIKDGSIDDLKKLIKQMSDKNCFEVPNLVILACKNNKVEALKYLLTIDGEAPENDKEAAKLSNNVDDCQHNAFYYALLSGNTELLDTLVTKWIDSPNNAEELDDVLSNTYEEFKLRNIPLPDDISVYVETQLINLRFFSNNTKLPNSTQLSLTNIKEHIRFLVENIALLSADYSNEQKIDDRFLFLAKFVAQNIHVLKQQLKSTYKVLPWEEIEFCLVSFTSLHVKKDKITDLFCRLTLDKKKILKYLDIFSEKLQEEAKKLEDSEIQKINLLPMISRELAVEYIVRLCPEFEDLYNDHQQIRDIHSLSKMKQYIELSLATDDTKKKENQLVITRALTVIGAHMRNSLESPKLSRDISDFLLFSLSKNTKKIIIGLRDSLTHASALFQRTKYIEENKDVKFFMGIQEDLKKLGSSIADTLNKSRIEIMRKLLKEILDNDRFAQIKEMTKTFMNSIMLDEMHLDIFKVEDHHQIVGLLKEIETSIFKSTAYEEVIFIKIDDIIESEPRLNVMSRLKYIDACRAFLLFNAVDDEPAIYQIREIKYWATQLLEGLFPIEAEVDKFKSISKLSLVIFDSLKPRTQHDKLKMKELTDRICGINFVAYFATSDVKFRKQLLQAMNARFSEIEEDEPKNNSHSSNENYFEQLNEKFCEIKNLLGNTTLSDETLAIEVLLLDILTILDVSKICLLDNNFLSINANAPLIIGKNLRNHLAHGDALMDLLLSNSSTSVYAISKKLVEEKENIIAGNIKIGKKVQDDLTKIKEDYERRLMIVTNQENMFTALQNGDFFEFLCCLEKGADVHAKCFRMRTALHYASIGGNLAIVKNLFDQNVSADVKDVHGKTPLHVAAEYGSTDIVEYLLEKHNVDVDETTGLGETPLHLAAAKGHKETVEILLKYNAKTDKQNVFKLFSIKGLVALQKSVLNHHKDVVEVLLKKEHNSENINKLDLLYLASKSCNQDLVRYLIKMGANVNGNDPFQLPLHLAVQNGNLAIANTLIEMKADVNLGNIEIFVPLHFASINGHEKLVETLLKHGADIDYKDYDKNTPLHYAIKYGHEKVIEILLKNGANADLCNSSGSTPFHVAIKLGRMEIINSLVKHGVKINTRDILNLTTLHHLVLHGWNKEIAELLIKYNANVNAKADLKKQTPLHLAAMKGDPDFVAFLVKNGAEVNLSDEDYQTPLLIAACNGKLDVVKILLEKKALINVDSSGECMPLFQAAYCGSAEVVEYLLENGAREDRYKKLKYFTINAAITWGHVDVLKVLLKYRSKINDTGIENGLAAYAAVDAGHKDILEILIANGANVNPKGMGDATPLCSAIRRNRKEIIELLVSNGAKVEGENGEPMFMAAAYGFNDALEYLLEKKARLKTEGPNSGENLLISATSNGHKDIVNTLIRNGISVNASHFNGYFAAPILYLALSKEQNEIVKILIDNGANVNAKNEFLGTPLQYAVAQNNFECVKTIIESGNVKINKDFTILHVASENGNLEIVKYLVDNGSNINAKASTDDGEKAIHVAAKHGFQKIVEYFINKGQSVDELNSIKQTPLHLASLNNQMEVAKYLILQKADVNYQDKYGRTSLHFALQFNFTDIAKLLLDNGALSLETSKHTNIPDQSKQVKKNKSKNKNQKKSENREQSNGLPPNIEIKLISKNVALVSNKNQPFSLENERVKSEYLHLEQLMLRDAVKDGDVELLKDFIEMGKDLNYIFTDGWSLLHTAVHNGRTDFVRILLSNGANVGQLTNKGNTPLHTAVSKNNKEIVDILLQHSSRCQLNEFIHAKTTNSGSTALHVAATNNSLDIIKSLLKNGAVHDDTNQKGEVPCSLSSDQHVKSFLKLIENLFTYVKSGNSEAVQVLKTLNIDEFLAATNARNNQGSTLLQVAIANKKTNITNQLLHMIKTRNQI